LAAIASKQGDSTSRLADCHNVSQQTIRNWLRRFENRPLEDAPFDGRRAGRPRKLTDDEPDELREVLHDSPENHGFDHHAWVPRPVYHYLQSEYGVEYSLRHIRRLMHEARLSWRTARPTHYEADPEQATEFQETVKKRTRVDLAGWMVIAVDQFSKPIETVQCRGWHRIGSAPTIEVNPSTDRVTVLGAVTHEGESFYCWTEENLTAAHGVRLLGALEARFGEDLIVCLDQAPYFYAKDLWKCVSGEERIHRIGETSIERVRNETLHVWYFPPRHPELNPVEGCWNQLEDQYLTKPVS